MKADPIPCLCTAAYCTHHKGVTCGSPVTMAFPIRLNTGPAEFGPEVHIGICEECWSNIEEYGGV
jgi:hypothetical protein